MKSSIRILTFFTLLVTLMVATVAANSGCASDAEPADSNALTAVGGELRATWRATAGAQYYSVGWRQQRGNNADDQRRSGVVGCVPLHDHPGGLHQPHHQWVKT